MEKKEKERGSKKPKGSSRGKIKSEEKNLKNLAPIAEPIKLAGVENTTGVVLIQ